MRIKTLSAALLSLGCAILTAASCAEGPTPPPTGSERAPGSGPIDVGGTESTGAEEAGMTLQEELREDVGETAQAFGRVVHCLDSETNADCAERCGEAGIGCAPQRRHPNSYAAGLGDLYACADVPHSCVYSYSNGDRCWFVTTLLFPICRYTAN